MFRTLTGMLGTALAAATNSTTNGVTVSADTAVFQAAE